MAVSLSERFDGKITPYGAFAQQRRDAKKRHIEFLFTFDEWVGWWETNLGPDWISKRGPKRGQFVMARYNDKGPYHLDNVKCITSEENHVEGNLGKFKPGNSEHARLLGYTNRGRIPYNKGIPMKEESKAKLRKPKSEETKKKISIAMMGKSKIKSETHRKALSEAAKRRWARYHAGLN